MPASTFKQHGICSHFIYSENGQLIASTDNGRYKHKLDTVEDYYFFLGKNKYNLKVPLNVAVNDPHLESLSNGYRSCSLERKIKTNK